MNIFFIIKVRIEVLINRSSGLSSVMLTFEPSMVAIFRACNAIDIRNTSSWCPFLEPHRATYHSNIDVLLREVTDLGKSTLGSSRATWLRELANSRGSED